MNNRNFSSRRTRRSRRAFTLVEVLVALSILAIMLVIIVLPLRLGFDSFNKGNAQNLTQSAVQSTLTDMGNDIRDAVYVFPNARVVGVTDREPYVTKNAANVIIPTESSGLPYYLSTDNTDIAEPGKGAPGNPNGIACSANSKPWSNPSTLSMIQVRRDGRGSIVTPLAPSYNLVTYYARRQLLTRPYDPIDNPIVMYRAEYPAFGIKLVGNGPDQTLAPLIVQSPANAFNAKVDFKRVLPTSAACTADAAGGNRSSLWLSHNYYGEADLLPLTQVGKAGAPTAFQAANGFTVAPENYSHALAMPRGLALEAGNAYRSLSGPIAQAQGALVPDTSFTTTDANGDGKIDRVTISLGLASFQVGSQPQIDDVTKQPKGTALRGNLTVDLPNIK